MRKTKSNSLGTIVLLLLLIPALIGIYKGANYLIEDTSTSETSQNGQNRLEVVDIYVNQTLVQYTEFTYLHEDLGTQIEVNFKMPGTQEKYDKKINYIRSVNAKKVMTNIILLQTPQQVKLVFKVSEKIRDFNILFTDESTSFFFNLILDFKFDNVSSIEIPNITFYE